MSDADIIREFLVESYENLDRLDRDLIALEKDPKNRETLASVFRTIHTIKGTSGFLALNQLGAVTHIGENLLARLRDGLLMLNPEITSALLAMVDAVRQMLASIEATGNEGERNDLELVATLTRLQNSAAGPAGISDRGPGARAEDAAQEDSFRDPVAQVGEASAGHDSINASELCTAAEQSSAQDPQGMVDVALDKKEAKTPDGTDAQNTPQPAKAQSASDSTIRVDVSQLDRLMNRMGELVLLRNQIVQFTNSSEDNDLIKTSQRLNLLTTELQEGVMKTRMQPIDNIWAKFPRTVRDVAMGCGKQVRIEMEGKETELDKTIIEAIKDPLTHLVRNAVDHGIESPEARQAAGNDPVGTLLLRAFHEGGQVNIEISDDGAGLNHEKIRSKALQKGLITTEHAARMTEREITSLILLPGFSTAEKITNVSGRGVGLDVVKTNIEKIGGTVDVQSEWGQGCTVRMKIPLTLAIIPALVVTSGGDRYAIPQVSLLELVRLEGEQLGKGIELVNGAPVHRLRGHLLPLVYLNKELGIHEPGKLNEETGQTSNIVILQAEDRSFGLVVDEINDTEEIVVKPLSKQLKNINTYAGATIMGDGRVALILDVVGLAHCAKVVGEVRNRAGEEISHAPEKVAAENNQRGRKTMLLFRNGELERMAIDLALVSRLEEIPRKMVEYSGTQEMIQYRGNIIPLIRVADILGKAGTSPVDAAAESLQVVVYSDEGRTIGLVIDQFLDIVDETFTIQPHTERMGVLGAAVIQQRTTEVLDVRAILAAALPEQVAMSTQA